MFVPATVGIIENWGAMKEFIVAIIAISLVSTVVVMAATGHVTQYLLNRRKEGKR